ncbi:MAG: hypothetical protein LBQ88_16460 [Treponema sp.]|jgi:NDP-sugar pyrophosphorylase family protein|nr:hypothetical protein [Treponema sp.]
MTLSLFFEHIPEILKAYFDDGINLWEPLTTIAAMIRDITAGGTYREIKPGVFVGKEVKIESNAILYGPAFIGEGCEIRPGAFIRENVIICKGSVIGNSTEVKNSILFEKVQVPHFNYIGDSIMGNGSHLGAGVILSNYRLDGKTIDVKLPTDKRTKTSTGLTKLGSIIGDNVQIGCNSVINPGTIIEKGIWINPLSNIRSGYYAAGSRFEKNWTNPLLKD